MRNRFMCNVVLIVAQLAGHASAQSVYSWRDADGDHFTNDINAVPEHLRAEVEHEARSHSDMNQRSTPAANDVFIQVEPSSDQPKEKPVQAPTPPVVNVPAPPEVRYGSFTERQWRDKFIAANKAIEQIKVSTRELSEKLKILPVCEAIGFAVPLPRVEVPNQNQRHQTKWLASQGCFMNREYERVELEIEEAKADLRNAEADLEELERQASSEAVPREWRRGW